MNRHLLLILITFLSHCTLSAKSDDEVIIRQFNDTYRFIPTADGASLARVEHYNETVFEALKADVTAAAFIVYNDRIKIGKVTGGEQTYGSFFSKDVFFSDSKACIVKAHLDKPSSTRKVSYKRTYTKPEFFNKVLLIENYPMDECTVRFEIPVSLSTRYKIITRNIPDSSLLRTEERKGDKCIITYTLSNVDSPEDYSDSPSLNVTAPQFHITGHFADPQELYRYLLTYIPESDPDEASVTAKAKELTAGCTTDRERIDAINRFVHSAIRYVAVEHGEFGQRPDLPSEVLRKRFGDCKGSAALIRAMLRAVGIDGRYVWVGTNDIGHSWSEIPNLSAGNHMIAAAMTGDSILYIDGTAAHNPLGRIPSSYRGREVIIEDNPQQCILAIVPPLSPAANSRHEIIDVTLSPTLTVDVKGSITLRDTFHSRFLALESDKAPSQRPHFHASMFGSILNGCKPSKVTVNNSDSLAVISGEATLSGILTDAGECLYLDLNPMPALKSMKFDVDGRSIPGTFGAPSSLYTTLTLHLPDGYTSGEQGPDVEISGEWFSGTLSTAVNPDGRTITRTFSLTTHDGIFPPSQFASINADIDRLTRACSSKIEIKKSVQ